MGANTFLRTVASFGYKSAAKATKIWYGIPGIDGTRIAIKHYAARNAHATVATFLYFQQALAQTTLGSAAASGVYSATLTATIATGNNLAASDFVAIEQDDGVQKFARVVSWQGATAKTVVFDTALTAAASAGNRFWTLGVYGDTGQTRSKSLTAAGVQVTDGLEGGVLYATGKGQPMVALLTNPSAPSSIDAITVDYIEA
ncbi:MAG TPA: hypothetical protein VMZ92_16030 [Planctomycetota bacterium]|nr:hypothetical protein [Planctomycetota bacterium]